MAPRMAEIRWWRRAAALVLSCAVLAASTAVVLLVGDASRVLRAPTHYPWWVLALVYVPLVHYTIDFEFRTEGRSLTLSQVPMALGAAFVAPGAHLVAGLLAHLVDTVVLRRQGLTKVAFNVASGALELAIALAVLSLLPSLELPGPAFWLALGGAAVVADVVTQCLMTLMMQILGIPMQAGHLLGPLRSAVLLAPVATGLAVVAVAAVWTQPLTALVMAALVVVLTLAYRNHRRLLVEQDKTAALQVFVKNLGALDAEAPEAAEVLDRVRVLLHAEHLDLALVDRDRGAWRHLTAHEAGREAAFVPLDPEDAGESSGAVQTPERMAVPLLGSRGFLGLLTVTHRLGTVRDFDLGDVRLIEAVGTELAGALERGRLQADLARAATTDTLTGLPNLRELSRQLGEALASGTGLMIAAVAVDSFHEVNDTLGHEVGDDLLREVSRRLHRSYGDALIGRIGGGRFAVAVAVGEHGSDPELFGLGLRSHVEGAAQLGAVGTHVRLSVGVVVAPEHGDDGATLVRRAETAMYGARHVQGGPVVWEPLYEVRGQRRLAVVAALREALSNGSLGVAYQPKVRLSDGSVSGVEALARWTHPALGAIAPDEFIPLAEAAGLMGPLTVNVLRQALTACQGWQRRGGTGVGVAVNVSADTVLDGGFATEVSALLVATGIDPSLLTVELTESVLVTDPELAVQRMEHLRALGIRISMDDFGTGYSSLTYLRGLPVDEVKIDKSFVDGLDTDPANAAVVRAVVDIAHTLGLQVVAEGVEHDEQNRMLRALGVDEAQGYLHARPQPAMQTAAWLRRRQRA